MPRSLSMVSHSKKIMVCQPSQSVCPLAAQWHELSVNYNFYLLSSFEKTVIQYVVGLSIRPPEVVASGGGLEGEAPPYTCHHWPSTTPWSPWIPQRRLIKQKSKVWKRRSPALWLKVISSIFPLLCSLLLFWIQGVRVVYTVAGVTDTLLGKGRENKMVIGMIMQMSGGLDQP